MGSAGTRGSGSQEELSGEGCDCRGPCVGCPILGTMLWDKQLGCAGTTGHTALLGDGPELFGDEFEDDEFMEKESRGQPCEHFQGGVKLSG